MVAETLGGTIGSGVGTWGGRIVGGAVGELFGPEAVPFGAYLGGKVGGYVGQAAGDYIANHMSNANEKADGRDDAKVTCPSCGKRSKPNQTCDDDRLQELEAAKDRLGKPYTNDAFKGMNPKKLAKVTCAQVRQRLGDMRALRAARQKIQDECFKGNPEDGHEEAMKQLDNGIRNLEQLEVQQCGGPIA